jgi:hypothetical protein
MRVLAIKLKPGMAEGPGLVGTQMVVRMPNGLVLEGAARVEDIEAVALLDVQADELGQVPPIAWDAVGGPRQVMESEVIGTGIGEGDVPPKDPPMGEA